MDIVMVQGPVGGQAPPKSRTTEPGSASGVTVTTVSGAYGSEQAALVAPGGRVQEEAPPTAGGSTASDPRPPRLDVMESVSVRGPRNDASTTGPGPGPERNTWHGPLARARARPRRELRVRIRHPRDRHRRVRRVMEGARVHVGLVQVVAERHRVQRRRRHVQAAAPAFDAGELHRQRPRSEERAPPPPAPAPGRHRNTWQVSLPEHAPCPRRELRIRIRPSS